MFDPSKINLNKKNKNKKDTEKVDVLGSINGKKKVEKKEDLNKKTFLLNKKIEKKIKKVDETKEVIYDVNIKEFKNILELLTDKEKKYDFITFEPDEEKVKINFRKDKAIVETKFIRYNIYSNILLKTKSITKLKLEETGKTQEGKGLISVKSKNYDVLSKIVPSNFGENLFLKVIESNNNKKELKQKKNVNLWKIFTFLLASLLILLIIGGGFLAFVVLNAKTIDDVRFFTSLGINLNQINDFIGSIVFLIFSILVFTEIIFLIIFLYKFLLTKKEFKKRRIKYGIVSITIFIITFSTATGWLYIDKIVRSLPDWGLMALGEIQYYDNTKLKSDNFGERGAYIDPKKEVKELIGPIEIKFDVSLLEKNKKKSGINIEEFIWTFDGKEIRTTTPSLIKKFDKKGIINVSLTLSERNSLGEVKTEEIIVPSLTIKDIVKIEEIPQETGGKLVRFDARNLEAEGKAEWFYMDDLSKPMHKGYIYVTDQPIINETLIGLYFRKEGKEDKKLDKIFVIEGEKNKKLNTKIIENSDPIDDLIYTFKAVNSKLDSGAGIIDEFIWEIGGKEYKRKGVFGKLEESSKIEHKFRKYGKETIKLTIIDSAGNRKTIKKEIEVRKKMRLAEGLKIYSDTVEIENLEYKAPLGEYYIKDLGIPTYLDLDARFIKPENILYTLESVSWDFDANGSIDTSGKQVRHQLVKVGANTIKVIYTLKNRKVENDKIQVEEYLYIDAIKKDAIIKFKIIKDSSYVPTKVGFDASMSVVKNKNISKFVWDFGDGIKEERDSIVPGHIYTKEGNYNIKLIIITEDGTKYSTEKMLILKPTAQTVKINVSMKEAEAFQEIDFSSSNSSGDIVSYFWDFGDGETSTEANPSHFYKKSGKYKVKLILGFRNKNVMEETMDIVIY